MKTITDLAITLRSVVFEERHKVVTGLTAEHGKITVIARNAIQSRRYGGSLDVFSASEWMWVEKEGAELGRLDRADSKRAYDGLRKSFEKLSMASTLNELLLKVAPEREACPDLFRLHSNALAWLEESKTPPDLRLLNFYLAKLLQWSGHQPQLAHCMACERPIDELDPREALCWSVPEAAWVCSHCRMTTSAHVRNQDGMGLHQSMIRVPTRSMTDLIFSMAYPIRKALELSSCSSEDHVELFQLMQALTYYHIPGLDGTPLKALRFLTDLPEMKADVFGA